MVVVCTLLVLLGAVVVLFPILWMLSTSLKTRFETLAMPPIWIPKELQWANYRDALSFNPFGLYAKNTVFYTLSAVLGELVSCSFIAYGFARLRSPLRNYLFLLMLSTMMLPSEVTLIPTYILFSKLGWTNSFKPLIVPAFFGSAYLIFMLRQFYAGIPREYDEAAIIDGASYFGIWWRIILPNSKPALGAVAIMSFMWHWNQYQGPPDLSERQQQVHALSGAVDVPDAFWGHPVALADGGLPGRRPAVRGRVLYRTTVLHPGHRHQRRQGMNPREPQ